MDLSFAIDTLSIASVCGKDVIMLLQPLAKLFETIKKMESANQLSVEVPGLAFQALLRNVIICRN